MIQQHDWKQQQNTHEMIQTEQEQQQIRDQRMKAIRARKGKEVRKREYHHCKGMRYTKTDNDYSKLFSMAVNADCFSDGLNKYIMD